MANISCVPGGITWLSPDDAERFAPPPVPYDLEPVFTDDGRITMAWVQPKEVLALNKGELHRALAAGTVVALPDGSLTCPGFPSCRVLLNG